MAKNGDGCNDWFGFVPDTDILPTCSRRQDMHRFLESFLAMELGILDTDSVLTPTRVTFDAL